MERIAEKSRDAKQDYRKNDQPAQTQLQKTIQHQTRSTTLAPNNPRGMKESTSRIMENATASL